MRSPLVVTSIGIHLAIGVALLVAGFWKLERLEPGRRPFDLAVSTPPPPAPSGSPAAAPTPAFVKKRRIVVAEVVQPTRRDPETQPVAASDATGHGTGGTGSGAGSGSGTDPEGTGTCTTPPCGDTVTPRSAAPPVAQPPRFVPPTVIKGLRMAGDTQIHPPAPVKTAILRDGKTKVTATFRVCIGTSGEVSALTLEQTSGYRGYDEALDAGLRLWRYRPYQIGGRKVSVCGRVTFIYAIQ
jgi:outer membrane biosynthesis protein TonB